MLHLSSTVVVMFVAHVLNVLIATPGDTQDELGAVQRAVAAWNSSRAAREAVVLLPRHWRTDGVPRLGSSGQAVINEQLVDNADIVVALFDSRLGQATDEAVSGTAEEIGRAHAAGKPVHVWFSNEALPRDVDVEQLARLRAFKEGLQVQGLLGEYDSPDDLLIKVNAAFDADLELLALGAPRLARRTNGAQVRARFESDREPYYDSRGRMSMRSRNERITLANSGDSNADGVVLTLEAVGDGEAPELYLEEGVKPDLLPNSEFSWPVMIHMGTASQVIAVISYVEEGETMEVRQHLRL